MGAMGDKWYLAWEWNYGVINNIVQLVELNNIIQKNNRKSMETSKLRLIKSAKNTYFRVFGPDRI